MVGLHAIKSTFDDNGIKDSFVEGNLSVEELMTIITAVFENQSGVRGTNRIDVSLASELVLNWILNVYDPWVQYEFNVSMQKQPSLLFTTIRDVLFLFHKTSWGSE